MRQGKRQSEGFLNSRCGIAPAVLFCPLGQFQAPVLLFVIVIGILLLILWMLWFSKKASRRLRRLQAELAQSEENFQALVVSSNDWIWQIDAELTCTYSSPQVLDILGYSPQEVLGHKPFDFMTPEEAARIRGIVEDAVRQKKPFRKLESRSMTKDGRSVIIETNGTPLLDSQGRLKGFRGVNRDITVQRQAEQAAEEYRRQTENLIGNLFGLAYRCADEPSWPMQFISPRCLELTGYSPDDFISRRVLLNDLIHPDDRQAVWDQVQQALEKKCPFDIEYRLIDRSGRTRWVMERGGGVWNHGQLEAVEGLIVDISDYKIVQQQLQQNQEFLESIIRSAPIGISVTIDRVFVNVNQQFCKMFGYSREELIGASTRILYPSQEAYEEHGHRLYSQIEYTGSATAETVFRKKDGQSIDVLMSGAPLDPADWSKGVTFSLMDITERNRVTEKLALRLKMERLVSDVSGGFVNLPVEGIDDQIHTSLRFLVDRLGTERVRLAQISPDTGAVSLSHYFSAEPGPRVFIESDDLDRDMPDYAALIRQNQIVWWPDTPSDIPDAMPALKRYFREKGIRSHLCIPMTVGQQHVGALLVTHIRRPLVLDPDILSYLRVIADTLANALVRKSTLLALAESERRFRSIIESSPMGILAYQLFPDDRLVLIGANPAACKILGIDVTALVGQTIQQAFPELAQTDLCRIYADICRRGGVYSSENFAYKDQQVKGFYDFEAFQTSGGKMAVMFTDVTERRLAEQARERLMRQLRAKNEELESIVFIASHDLRSPLVNIRGFSGELEKCLRSLRQHIQDEPLSDPARRQIEQFFDVDAPEALAFINAGSAKMETMLDGLLSLSRVSSAQSRPQRLNMNGLLDQVIQTFEYRIKEDGAAVDIAPDLPDSLGDPLLITQVFSNLIENAIKYRSPDRPLVLRVEASDNRDHVEYRVIDNGIGIAPEHLGKVFEIYHQLNPGREKSGQGLGLTIVRKILDAHDGRVWLQSAPGQGTTVFVRLPKPNNQ
jgi:PAS domain S-box-containing protein